MLQIMNGQSVTDATGATVPKVKVDLYAGIGGSSTGQYGQYVELIAVAYDNGGARHVRRLELQAENFARYAMFVDQWAPGCYTTGEIVRGRAQQPELAVVFEFARPDIHGHGQRGHDYHWDGAVPVGAVSRRPGHSVPDRGQALVHAGVRVGSKPELDARGVQRDPRRHASNSRRWTSTATAS
ncbi:MAG: hypothetical protein U0163_20775 [Gemmatimonadaceae bacterium]